MLAAVRVRSGRLLRVAAGLAVAVAVAGATCEDEPGEQPPSSGVVTIRGRLTSEGVTCPAMRDEHGTLYTLSGSIHDFRAGSRVCVRGTVAEQSVCQQGTTIVIEWIVPARMCP